MIGLTSEPSDVERKLHNWLMNYVTDPDSAPHLKASKPLRAAEVAVVAKPGVPGVSECVMPLCPHFQLDTMAASVKLTTDLRLPT